MDTIRLRTLTEKSILGFGKYADMTIQQIIDLRHTGYLRWIYYAMEGISFTDNILTRLGIFNEKHDDRIVKPGKDIELGEKMQGINFNKMCHILNSPTHANKAVTIHKRIALKNYLINDMKNYSKSRMQQRNHGKSL